MAEDNIVKKTERWKPVCKRPVGRPKTRWEDEVLEGIKSINARMAEDNIVQEIQRWKAMSKRPIGRPKTRSEDEVLEGIKSVIVGNWKKVAQNGDSWKKVVEQARTL